MPQVKMIVKPQLKVFPSPPFDAIRLVFELRRYYATGGQSAFQKELARRKLTPYELDAVERALDAMAGPEMVRAYEARHPEQMGRFRDRQAQWDEMVRQSLPQTGSEMSEHRKG